jgi:hypothetical protein
MKPIQGRKPTSQLEGRPPLSPVSYRIPFEGAFIKQTKLGRYAALRLSGTPDSVGLRFFFFSFFSKTIYPRHFTEWFVAGFTTPWVPGVLITVPPSTRIGSVWPNRIRRVNWFRAALSYSSPSMALGETLGKLYCVTGISRIMVRFIMKRLKIRCFRNFEYETRKSARYKFLHLVNIEDSLG